MLKEDLDRLKDQDFLLAKKRISEDVISLLKDTEENLKKQIQSADFDWPERSFLKAGKISRGENYRDLPFFILDYPRKFSKEASFAYRSMIWWGNDISFTLHLSGKDLNRYRHAFLDNISALQDYYLCVNSTPWEYHFGPENYQSLKELNHLTIEKHLAKDFLKISIRYELSDIKKVPSLAVEHLNNYLLALSKNH